METLLYETEALKTLRAVFKDLSDKGITQKDVATLLHPAVHGSMLSRWLSGKARPDLKRLILLVDLADEVAKTRLSCRDFLTPEERDQVAGCFHKAKRGLEKRGVLMKRRGRKP